jgi:hypothetical protein
MKISFSALPKSNHINRAAAHSSATTAHQKLAKNKKISTKAQKMTLSTAKAQQINVTATTATALPVISTPDQKLEATATATPVPLLSTPFPATPTAKPTKNKPKGRSHKYYAVAKGRLPGIYTSWPITQTQVCGYSGTLFQGFHHYTEAQHFLYVYATHLLLNDRNYLGQTLGLSTTNVNVHINTLAATTPATKDSPPTPSTQASDPTDNSFPDEYTNPAIDDTHDDTNEEISKLKDDDNDDDHSYNCFD